MLNINVEGIQNKFIPATRNSVKYLDSARSILSSAYIPNSFNYRSTIKSISSQLIGISDDIIYIEKWVEERVDSILSMERKNASLADDIFRNVNFDNEVNVHEKTSSTVAVNIKTQETTSNMNHQKSEEKNVADESFLDKILNSLTSVSDYAKDFISDTAAVTKSAACVVGSSVSSFFSMTFGRNKREDSNWLDRLKNVFDYESELDKLLSMDDLGIDNGGFVPYEYQGNDIIFYDKYNEKTSLADKFKNLWGNIKETGANVCESVGSFVNDKVMPAIEDVGCKIALGWNIFADKASEVLSKVDNVVATAAKVTTASVTNLALGLVKGLNEFVEALEDVVVILGAATIGSLVAGGIDGITYLFAYDKEDWSSKTASMWKNVMGFVAEERVKNKFRNFYQNTMVGQWLDENAAGWLKSDGFGTNIASGIGYVAGIIALTIATFGIGTAASVGATVSSAAVSGTIAAAAGTGQYTQEAWGKMKASYDTIKNLSEEEWNEVVSSYYNGEITYEEYNTMQQIRLSEGDWRTFENGIKGIGYGVANGAWEGVQYYIGGKLATFGASKILNKVANIGVDTAFNAADTFFRVGTKTIISDEPIHQLWLEEGAWGSVRLNTAIGLIGSVGGELIDFNKILRKFNSVVEKIKSKYPSKPRIKKVKTDVSVKTSFKLDDAYFIKKTQAMAEKFSKMGYDFASMINEYDERIFSKKTIKGLQQKKFLEKMILENQKVDVKKLGKQTVKDVELKTKLSDYYEYMLTEYGMYDSISAKKFISENFSRFENTQMHNIGVKLKEVGAKVVNDAVKTLEFIPGLVATIISRASFKKVRGDLLENTILKNKTLNEGLLHFTSEKSADLILDSGYLKRSNKKISYGTESTFFFAGIPDAGSIAMNIGKMRNKMVAIKIKPTEEVLDKFKYRIKDDNALLWEDNFNFRDMGLKAEKAYFVLENNNGKYEYREVSKVYYDKYDKMKSSKNQSRIIDFAYQLEVMWNKVGAPQFENVKSVFSNTFSGLSGSALGGIFNNNKNINTNVKQTMDRINEYIEKELAQNRDLPSIAKKLLEYNIEVGTDSTKLDVLRAYLTEYMVNNNYNKIEVDNYLNNIITNKVNLKEFNAKSGNDFFDELAKSDGLYGVDQGIMKKLYQYRLADGTTFSASNKDLYDECLSKGLMPTIEKSEYYDIIKCKIMSKYEMSSRDAERFISALDSQGVCSYASTANDIIAHFKDNPELYEQIFGFSLYRRMQDGTYALNSEELLADIYFYDNHIKNGGKLFVDVGNNNYVNDFMVVDNYQNVRVKEQGYMMTYKNGIEIERLNSYLKSKNANLHATTEHLAIWDANDVTDDFIKNYKEALIEEIEAGNQCSLGVWYGEEPVRFIDMNTNEVYITTHKWKEGPNGGKGGAHALKITGMTDEGLICSTWGMKCLVPFEDLKKNGRFITTTTNFQLK